MRTLKNGAERIEKERGHMFAIVRAKIKYQGGIHTAEDIEKLWEHAKGQAVGGVIKNCDEKYHVDHRIAIARGGSNGPENLGFGLSEMQPM